VRQDRIRDWDLACDLVCERFVSLVGQLLALLKHCISVDFSTLLGDPAVLKHVHADDILLVEVFRPSLRDAVLDFVLDALLVWTPRQSGSK